MRPRIFLVLGRTMESSSMDAPKDPEKLKQKNKKKHIPMFLPL